MTQNTKNKENKEILLKFHVSEVQYIKLYKIAKKKGLKYYEYLRFLISELEEDWIKPE